MLFNKKKQHNNLAAKDLLNDLERTNLINERIRAQLNKNIDLPITELETSIASSSSTPILITSFTKY